MAKVLFWCSAVFVLYVYFGYPLLLVVWRRIARRKVRKVDWEPTVTVIVAARNDEVNIETKLRNCLQLDYPRHKLQIILSLDGPANRSEAVHRICESHRIHVIDCRVRQGKAAALNRGVAEARGDVIVFLDARQRIDRCAIRELVANLFDQSVGAVSGELILQDDSHAEVHESSKPIGLYWRYDKLLRSMESDIHSSMGASGALYAIRRKLFQPLPPGTILDDVLIPLRIVLSGWRVVFEPSARAFDKVACCPEAEFARKVRTLMGNYQLLAQMPELLLPWRNPIFLQFVSHKVGRLLVPYFLAVLFIANCFLLQGFYLIPFGLQLAWYLLALAGHFSIGIGETQIMRKQIGSDDVRGII